MKSNEIGDDRPPGRLRRSVTQEVAQNGRDSTMISKTSCFLRGFCYNRSAAEVNLARWLAWTSNPVGFTGRWARWVRFPCTSAIFVLNGLSVYPTGLLFKRIFGHWL